MIRRKQMNSKNAQVLEALQNGEELTAKQIAARYGAKNPHDVVYNLRNQGYCIYLNEKRNSKGEVVAKYRIGTPTRKHIAAGYKAMQLGLV
jgi:predicted transcriptional regulator